MGPAPFFYMANEGKVGAQPHREATTWVLHMAQGLCASSLSRGCLPDQEVLQGSAITSHRRQVMEHYSVTKRRKGTAMHIATRVNLRKNMMLSKGSHMQKSVIPFLISFTDLRG